MKVYCETIKHSKEYLWDYGKIAQAAQEKINEIYGSAEVQTFIKDKELENRNKNGHFIGRKWRVDKVDLLVYDIDECWYEEIKEKKILKWITHIRIIVNVDTNV